MFFPSLKIRHVGFYVAHLEPGHAFKSYVTENRGAGRFYGGKILKQYSNPGNPRKFITAKE